MNNNIFKLKTILTCLVFTTFISISNAKLVQDIRSVEYLMSSQLLEWADSDTMILIEVDNTIVAPKSDMFSYKDNPYKGFISSLVKLGKKNNEYNQIVASWYQKREVKILDKKWGQLISLLKDRGAKVFGVCSMPLRLVNVEQKRLAELSALGISFTPEVNKKNQFIIKSQTDWASRFYSGIIFTGRYSQTRTILDFLRETYIPKKLLFVSHKIHELKNLDKKLRVFNMDFYSVHYSGIKYVSKKPIESVVKFQQRELLQNSKWIEDEEVKNILGLN